jgi:uncharacterized protein YegJ (DUF2314 family)
MSRKSESNDRLALAKAITNMSSKMDTFSKAVENMQKYEKEKLETLDMEIAAKNRELSELDERTKVHKKDLKIQTDQWLAEYKYEGAMKFLQEIDEMPIKKSEFEALKKELADLKANYDQDMANAVKKEKEHSAKALKSAVNTAELKFKAETAVIQATIEQQKKEIQSLESTIDGLKVEIAAQRKLTQSVAEAGRAAPITQSFAK